MWRFWVLSVLLSAFLFGAAKDSETLSRADALLKSGEKTQIFRAYNDYKNLYLRAVMNQDDTLRRRSLQGIVKSGGILRIDVARYEQELQAFKDLPPSAPEPKKEPAPLVKPASKPAKTAPEPAPVVQKLTSIRWKEGRLLLEFDSALQEHEVNYFKLFDKEKGRYRYIFDVDATMATAKEELHHGGIRRISLARYTSDKLRLVIENDKALPIRFKNEGRQLVINPGVAAPSGGEPEKPEPVAALAERYHLHNVGWDDGALVLDFDQTLPAASVDFSRLEDSDAGRYRYLFDFKGGMINDQFDLRHQSLKSIRVAQFDTKTVRLVIENDTRLDVSYERQGARVVINLGVTAVPASEAVEAVPAAVKPKERTIVIDPGHGGKDAGAVGHNRYREKVVVFQIANELSKVLKQQGYRVYMTRTGDSFVKLQNRTQFANKKQADLFISIHANAVPKQNIAKAEGIETYFLSNDHKAGSERAKRVAQMENSKDLQDVTFYGQQDFINILNREKIKKSERLAYDLQRNVLAVLQKNYDGVKDGGVREGPFWILVGAQMPAVLVEVGFITHPDEAKRLVNRTYQKRFVDGLANGIGQYFINNPY